jgi:two-component system, NtrC family, response regulator AtoC
MRERKAKTEGQNNSDFKSQSNLVNASSLLESTDKLFTSFMPHILIVDDDDLICRMLEELLIQSGYTVSTCTQAINALEKLEKECVDIVLTDVGLPDMSGVELTERIIEKWADVPVIVMTGSGEIEIAVQVLKLGASDFIRKPFAAAAIQESIKLVLKQSLMFAERRHLQEDLKTRCRFEGMVSRTAEMHRVFETIQMVAETDTTVVIEGETGTGKELVARALHQQSARREGPFVTINCAGLPETLLESELFGYERGAFTGADRARPGKIELAHRGTLFFDEIESMPLTMQAKLLLGLETQKVQRLGASRSTHIDMRVIAATNIPLKDLRDKGLMRSDFYYRIHVVLIRLLPLRMRVEDIPLLVQDFLRHHPIAKQKKINKISTHAMDRLMKYQWPGNVRELQNVLENALVLARSRVLENVELPDAFSDVELRAKPKTTEVPPNPEDVPFAEWIKYQEREYLIRKLKVFRGRIGLTAKGSGLDVRTVYRKMRLYGLDKQNFSNPMLASISRGATTKRLIAVLNIWILRTFISFNPLQF